MLLLGAQRTTLHNNWIVNNQPGGDSFLLAGLVMISAEQFGGQPLKHDTISHNTITGNSPLDVFYDGSGFGQQLPGQHLRKLAAVLDLQLT